MNTPITAAVLRDPESPFNLESAELDDPRADEILIKLEATGICHTDIVMKQMVPCPSVLGHEAAGIVEKVGADVSGVEVGDRVVVGYPWCGECPECEDEHRYRCEQNFTLSFSGGRLDGSSPISQEGHRVNAAVFQQSSFATYVVAPVKSVVKVDKSIPAEVAASLTCAVFTGAGISVNSFGLGEGDDLMVFGTGVVGLSAIMAAHNLGVNPIVAVDLNDERLEFAKELGATHTINPGTEDVIKRTHEIKQSGFKHILDTSGVGPAWVQALECLGQGGNFGFVTVPQPWESFALKVWPLMPKAATMSALIQGSSSVEQLVPKMEDWYKTGKFPIDRLIKTYKFTDINHAFDDMKAGSVIKPVLLFDDV